jgi:predicted transcriptional regulator
MKSAGVTIEELRKLGLDYLCSSECDKCLGIGQIANDTFIGDEMQQRRTKAGKTLADISASMGFTISYLSDLEHGRKKWTLEKIKAYQEAIGIK